MKKSDVWMNIIEWTEWVAFTRMRGIDNVNCPLP